MFKLVIEDDEGNKTVVPIVRDEITIGRREGNTIRLTERNVSRDHAKLTRRNGEVYIRALSARYGIKRNGDKLAGEEEFILGDVIEIGDYRLALQSDAVTEAKKPPSMPPAKLAPPPPEAARTRRVAHEGTEIIDTDPARLVIVSSNFAGQEFPLARREMVIGRGEECDIIIDHRSVSQTHAKVVRESSNGEYKIIDLKSKNGVKVGGEEYRAVHLKRGDIVDLGHVKFRFVESGENYVFTPQPDDDVVALPASSNKGGVVAIAFIALMAVSGAVAWFISQDPTPAPTPLDSPVAVASADTDAESTNNLDEKIDKAEQDYLAAKVQKAAGMLELLREDDPTPSQVERIDDLLSKTKREVGFVRHYENGLHHFEEERWLPALQELRQIPDDDSLNIYRLVEQGRYIDQAVANATEEQLALAENAAADADRQAAIGRITELQAMFPSHVAPPEALAELAQLKVAAAAPPQPRTVTRKAPRNNPRPQPKRPKQTPPRAAQVPETDHRVIEVAGAKKPAGPTADELYKEAMAAMLSGKFNTAKSKGHEGLKIGCRHDCYRVIAMAHHKLGESDQACDWFAKAGVAPPGDLQCK